MRRLAALLVVALLTPSALAWNEAHGDMTRNGVAFVPAGPLDVVAKGSLAARGEALGMTRGAGVVPVGDETAFALQKGTDCRLVFRASFVGNASRSVPLGACNRPIAMAYDYANDDVLVAFNAGSSGEGVVAVAPDGARRWSFAPGAQLPNANPAAGWVVPSLAFDAARNEVVLLARGVAVAGANGPVDEDNRVVVLNATSGAPKWSRAVTSTESAPFVGGVSSIAPAAPGLEASTLTLSPDGIFVVGWKQAQCAACATSAFGTEAFLAWYSRGGDARGFQPAGSLSTSDASDPTRAAEARTPVGSEYAVARGSNVALALGGSVVVVNPADSAPVGRAPIQAPEASDSSDFTHASVWTERVIVLGLRHSLAAFDPVTLAGRWGQSEGPQWELVDVLVDSQGLIDSLYERAATHETLLVRATPDNALVGKLPLPLDAPAYDAFLTPTKEGLLLVNRTGGFVLLGHAEDARLPNVAASDAYPAPGTIVRLEVTTSAPADVAVSWGDGSYEQVRSIQATKVVLTHTFVDRGLRQALVSASYVDGTTATRALALDVGGTPPPDLTPLQEAFAPENQNLTFGVLGIFVTLLGGLVTLGRARRRTTRIERELGRLDVLTELAQRQPRDAARAVRDYRDRIRRMLGHGDLDEPQYHVLETRSARLLTALEARLVAPLEGKLSPAFRRRLAAAFDDATLHEAERDALVAALAAEALADSEKDHLRGILEDLTSRLAPAERAPETAGA